MKLYARLYYIAGLFLRRTLVQLKIMQQWRWLIYANAMAAFFVVVQVCDATMLNFEMLPVTKK